MDRNNCYQDYEPDYEEDAIDIMELVRKIWSEKYLILKWIAISAVIGLIVGFSIPREYSSRAKLAPESSARNGSLGNLGSLAALAGMRVSAGPSADAVSPDLYPELVHSVPFVTEMFSMPVSFKDHKVTKEMDLFTYVSDEMKSPWWSAIVRLPFKAKQWVGTLLSGTQQSDGSESSKITNKLTKVQEQAYLSIKSRVKLLIDKKTSAMSIEVMMQNPEVAAQVANTVLEKLQDYITQYRTDKAVKDLEFTESLYEEARDKYYASQQKYARYIDAHQGMVLQSVKTEQERLKNEMDLDYQLYNSMAQDFQLGKAKVQEQTPVFTIYEPPMVALSCTKPSKTKTLIVFMFLGFCAAAVWVLYGRDFVNKFKNIETQE